MTKAMAAMSGGVDSSAVAVLLKQSGYDVFGGTLRLYDVCGKISPDIDDAKTVCDKLEIPHFVYDLRGTFEKKVISPFIDTYLQGGTPNPCIECNKHIKFGGLLTCAQQSGAEMIATGHYARIKKQGDRYLLCRGSDLSKDQTYVLYGLTQNQLAHTLLPLGELNKAQVREIAMEYGLVTAHKSDSQDICFVPDGDYAAFMEQHRGFKAPCGNYIDENGKVLGEHKGIIRYTIGQRKGLGIALGKHAFVLNKNVENNTVTLGDEDALFKNRVEVTGVNFIPFDKLNESMRVTAKLRYRHHEQPALIHPIDENNVVIEFDEPQRAPSPGQAAVFYDGETVIGGGTIK